MSHRPTSGPDASDREYHELAVGWALHALEPGEESAFAEHLPGCPDCQRTVRETEEVGALLASVVPAVEPPAGLEQRILAAATGQVDEPAAGGATVTELAGRRRPLRDPRRLLSAAAVIVLVAVSGVLGVRVLQLDEERDTVAGRAAELSEVVDRAADPAVRRVPLVTPDGRTVGLLLAEGAGVTVVPTALPENSTDSHTYVLWGVGLGSPEPLGAFDVSPEVPPASTVPVEAGQAAYAAYAVSLEPGRTPPAAPTEVVASGRVQG